MNARRGFRYRPSRHVQADTRAEADQLRTNLLALEILKATVSAPTIESAAAAAQQMARWSWPTSTPTSGTRSRPCSQ